MSGEGDVTETASGVLTPEGATTWQYPQDPQISPNAERVVFTLMDAARPDEHDRSAIWILDLKTSVTRRFTYGEREDSAARWSPDGSRIAFLSDRNEAGKKQIFLMGSDGGEARKLTRWKGGGSGARRSPE